MISVVLQDSVDGIAGGVVEAGGISLGSDRRNADGFGTVVILAVVVVPVLTAVCYEFDSVTGHGAGEVRLPNLGTVVKGGEIFCLRIAPADNIGVKIVNIYLLIGGVISGPDENLIGIHTDSRECNAG